MTPQEKLQMAVPAVAVSNANPSHQSTGLHSAETPSSIHFNARSQEITMSAVDAVLPAQDISIEKWQTPKSRTGNLGSLREEKSYEYNGGTAATAETEEQQKRHKAKQDTMFRLNTKRMSYKGFEFGDFGFMTTDFDQLSRGHTQFGITLRSLHIDSVHSMFTMYLVDAQMGQSGDAPSDAERHCHHSKVMLHQFVSDVHFTILYV